MIARIPRGTPNAGDAELAATTLRVLVRTINPAPCVATAQLDTPATGLGISNRLFDFLLLGCLARPVLGTYRVVLRPVVVK
jgi:hypothetical protein